MSTARKRKQASKIAKKRTQKHIDAERLKMKASRFEVYRAIPKGDWEEMSGRQVKVINEQAERYGLPFGGPTISLPHVVRALHDFLAVNAGKLSASTLKNEKGVAQLRSEALEQKRLADAQMAELKLRRAQGELVPMADLESHLKIGILTLRQAIERLEKRFGPDASAIIRDVVPETLRIWKAADIDAEKPRPKLASLAGKTAAVAGSAATDENAARVC